MRTRFWLPAGILAAAVAFSVSYAAGPDDSVAGCAVSALNGKLGGAAGAANNINGISSTNFGQLTGSVSAPVGCAFGVQIDGAVTTTGSGTWGGVEGHFFYRDPQKFLLGITGSYETGIGYGNVYRIGPELEVYVNNVNLEAWAGWATTVGGPSDWFAAVDAAVYPTENFRLSGGWRHSFGTDVAVARGEVQLSDTKPVSLFAEGRVGAGGYSVIKGGVNVYFGDTGKTLLQRRRTADPQNWLFDLLAAKANNTPSSSPTNGCTIGSDCPSGVCHSGTCLPPGTCLTSPDCSEGEYCDDGVCRVVPTCNDNNRCTNDIYDTETGSCRYVPNGTCPA
jgi:hypothetical protein